jgi:hypothetical protein
MVMDWIMYQNFPTELAPIDEGVLHLASSWCTTPPPSPSLAGIEEEREDDVPRSYFLP